MRSLKHPFECVEIAVCGAATDSYFDTLK